MNNWILKVLSGPHKNAEISLVAGDYVVGSEETDDIVLSGSGLQKSHFQLRLGETSVEVVLLNDRVPMIVAGEPQESGRIAVESLTAIKLGDLYFALGTAESDWETVAVAGEWVTAPAGEVVKNAVSTGPVKHEKQSSASGQEKSPRKKRAATILSTFGLVVLFAGLFFKSEEPRATDSVVRQPPQKLWVEIGNQLDTRHLELLVTDRGLVIKGYVKTAAELEKLHSLVQITGLEAGMAVAVVSDIVAQARAILQGRELNDLRVVPSEPVGSFVIEGVVGDAERWNEAFAEIKRDSSETARWLAKVQVEEPAEQSIPTVALGFSVRSVSVGRTPFLVADNGEKFAKGSRLASGHIIKDITTEFINLERGEKQYRVPLGNK